jgi:primosomal protein N'
MKSFRSNSLLSVLAVFNNEARIAAAQNELAKSIEQILIHNNVSAIEDTIADIGSAKADSQKGQVIALLSALQMDLRDKFYRIRERGDKIEALGHETKKAQEAFAAIFTKEEKTEEEKKADKAKKEAKAKKTALETAAAEGWLSPEEKELLSVEWTEHPETVRLQRALDEALANVERQVGIIKGHVQQAAIVREEVAELRAENTTLSGLLSRIGECRTIKAVRDILAA